MRPGCRRIRAGKNRFNRIDNGLRGERAAGMASHAVGHYREHDPGITRVRHHHYPVLLFLAVTDVLGAGKFINH